MFGFCVFLELKFLSSSHPLCTNPRTFSSGDHVGKKKQLSSSIVDCVSILFKLRSTYALSPILCTLYL